MSNAREEDAHGGTHDVPADRKAEEHVARGPRGLPPDWSRI